MEVGTFTAAEASTGSRTMADLALAAGAKFADGPALRHKVGDEWVDINYAELADKVRTVAAGLIELGIQPGDKVAILSNSRPEWTYACFGILAAGATCVLDLPDQLAAGVRLRAQPLGGARGVRRGRGAARQGPRGT